MRLLRAGCSVLLAPPMVTIYNIYNPPRSADTCWPLYDTFIANRVISVAPALWLVVSTPITPGGKRLPHDHRRTPTGGPPPSPLWASTLLSSSSALLTRPIVLLLPASRLRQTWMLSDTSCTSISSISSSFRAVEPLTHTRSFVFLEYQKSVAEAIPGMFLDPSVSDEAIAALLVMLLMVSKRVTCFLRGDKAF